MKEESKRLRNNVESVFDRFSQIPEDKASVNLSEGKWSLKEIFGHLIDSAANNYQRFIRLQETDQLDFPAYEYNWIHIIPYKTYPYGQTLELWRQYNLLICHIIDNLEENCLKNRWIVEGNEMSLEFLVKDYNDHMELHLEQLHARLKEVENLDR